VEADDAGQILDATTELILELLDRNGLTREQLISAIFTATPDLRAAFPASAARQLGITDVPLLCATEIDVPGALSRVIRLLVHVESDQPRSAVQHTYLRGTTVLRDDLAQ
jgi:chorismate mutase